MMGIVLSSPALAREARHASHPESLVNQYKPLAQRYRVDLGFFSFRQITPDLQQVEALVYRPARDSLQLTTVPVPRVNVVRNTAYVSDRGRVRTFEALHNRGVFFLNFPLLRQANKLKNYKHLHAHEQLKQHVPPTKRLSLEDCRSLLQQHGKVIIKPVYGSQGRGITIIEQVRGGCRFLQTSLSRAAGPGGSPGRREAVVPPAEFHRVFAGSFPRPADFLVQGWICFQEYRGRPFDIRVVVQKNKRNRWQVTSRLARVAGEKGYVTNLYQGGEALSLSQLGLKGQRRALRAFCLETARSFEKLYPWTAEMGIDLAFDRKGKLWFIETNFCPEKTRWVSLCKIPFEHGYYWYRKNRGRE
jgi:hypothetical protein